MNTETVILTTKSRDNLTANKPTTYARRRGRTMSADNAAEFGNVPQSDADKKIGNGEKQRGKFESFLAFLFKKKKAAKEWEEAFKKELKGKTIDKEKLEKFIREGTGPEEGLKQLLPSDIKEIPKIVHKETADEVWEEKKKAEQIPDEVVERMKDEQLPPESLVYFEGQYISSHELDMVQAIWQGFSNKSFDAISDEEKAKIFSRIAHGQPPISAVVEAIVSGEVASEPEEEISEDERTIIKELEQAHVQALLVEQAGEEMGAAVMEEEQEAISESEEAGQREEKAANASRNPSPLEAQVSGEEAEEILSEWQEELGEKAWEDSDTRSTAAMMSYLGIRPEQSRHGEDTPTAQEVVENARIAEEQEALAEELRSQKDVSLRTEIDALEDEAKQARFAKAEELLELPKLEEMSDEDQATEKERRIRLKQGLWEAHSYGKGEEGKFGGEAGIYNYTVEQLLNKRRLLVDAGYTKEQATKLIEWGVAGNVTIDPALYDPDTFTDSRAQELARYVQQRARDGGTVVSDRVLRNAGEMAQEIERKNVIEGVATPEDVRNMANRVLEDAQRGGADDEAIRRNLQLHLMGPEMDLLGRDPNGEGAMEWLNGEFDTIYQGSSQGQELDSPTLQELQRKVAYAIAYLNYTFPDRRDIAERFFAAFSIRQKLMVMRVVIGQRNEESLGGAAAQLRMHGVLSSFGFEDQNVRRMYMRMGEKLEDMRLNMDYGGFEKKVTAEMVRKMLQQVEEEEATLLENLAEHNPFWQQVQNTNPQLRSGETLDDARKREARNAITRSSRMAYDLFVASQREAIIVSRGRYPAEDPESYRSVPSGVFSFFNPEAMMWGGWDMKNTAHWEFFDKLKVDIAEEYLMERGLSKDALSEVDKVEYGGRMYKELSPIPDFFSSGWRRDVMMEQMKKLIIFKFLSESTVEGWKRRYTGITKNQIRDLLNEVPVIIDGRTISAKTDDTLKDELAELRRKFNKGNFSDDPDMQDAVRRGGERAEKFGLFAQLHHETNQEALRKGKGHAREDAIRVLDRIVAQKPEEIIRILRDRLPIKKESHGGHGGHHGEDTPPYKDQVLGDGHPGWHDELDLLQRNLARIMNLPGGGTGYIPSETITASGISAYDEFRNKYGSVITMLRENAMREDVPRVLDLANLTTEEQSLVNRAGIVDHNGNPVANAADVLMQSQRAMQDFIRTKRVYDPLAKQSVGVTQLMVQDYRFEDAYNKIWSVDDMFLDEIEEPPKVTGLLRASEIVSTEPGGDGYRRTMNDVRDGIQARNGLYTFITQETPENKMKGAQEFAAGIGSANGQEAIAKAMRFTYGSYLDMSKPYYWLDVIGLKGLPGRISVSEIQKIYGPEAHVFEREELRQIIDRDLRFMLEGSAGKKELQDRILYERGLIDEHELEHRKHKYVKENQALLESLKRRIGVTKMDEFKTKAIQVTLFILLAMLASAALAAVSVATEESTGSSGGGGGGGGGGHH